MKMTFRILILISAGILLVACDMGGTTTPPATPTTPSDNPTEPPGRTPGAQGDNKLVGTGWALATLNSQSALTDTVVTLNFTTNIRAGGTDGCNLYNGAYIADDTTIKFESPTSTMMACARPIMNQATDFTKALEQAATYQVRGSQLTLSDSGGKELATFDEQSSELTGTSWNVVSYNNGKGAVTSVTAGTSLTANFITRGTLTGSGGCNEYSGSYESDGKSTIKIGPLTSTRMACAQPVMDQEQQYLQALETAATYRIDGNKLEMRTADDTIAASFEKAAPTNTMLIPSR